MSDFGFSSFFMPIDAEAIAKRQMEMQDESNKIRDTLLGLSIEEATIIRRCFMAAKDSEDPSASASYFGGILTGILLGVHQVCPDCGQWPCKSVGGDIPEPDLKPGEPTMDLNDDYNEE